jgi:hypothetical protein
MEVGIHNRSGIELIETFIGDHGQAPMVKIQYRDEKRLTLIAPDIRMLPVEIL